MNDKKKSYAKPILFSLTKCKDCNTDIFMAKVSTQKGERWCALDSKPMTNNDCVQGEWYVCIEGSWASKTSRASVYFKPHRCEQGQMARAIQAPVENALKGLETKADEEIDDIPF